MPLLPIVITTALAALVGDAVVESIGGGGEQIALLGGSLTFDVGTTATLTILTACSAAAALAWAAAIAFARGRGLEHRMAEELDERWAERSQHNAGVEGKNRLLEYRVVELQTQLEDITGKRDEILQEMATVRERARELARVARDQQETIESLTESEGDNRGDVVRVPEVQQAEPVPAGDPPGDEADDRVSDEQPVAASDELRRLGF
jgi:hypothetical protein